MGKAARRKDMRQARQLERAREIFPDKSICVLDLKDIIFKANASDTGYIIYGIRND